MDSHGHSCYVVGDMIVEKGKNYKSAHFVLISSHSQVSGKNERTFVMSARFDGLLLLFNFLPRLPERILDVSATKNKKSHKHKNIKTKLIVIQNLQNMFSLSKKKHTPKNNIL